MKKVLILTGLLLAALLTALPVYASTITGATYVGTVTVTNTSTTASNVSFPFTLSTSNLITYNYVNSTLSNTSMQINGTDIAYMPARTGQTTWMMFSPSVTAGISTAKLYTGGGDMSGKIRYFPEPAGMQTVDSGDLEPDAGNNFKIELKAYFDFSTYTAPETEYLIYKQTAIHIYYKTAASIEVAIYPGPALTLDAAGLTSGEHTLIVQADGTDLKIYWDAVLKNSVALGAVTVPDNVNAWRVNYHIGNTLYIMPYIEYYKVFIPYNAALPEQHIKWENGATFTDLSGNGHFATPTWRTTTSDADVTAALSTFETNNLSQAGSYSIGGETTFITSVPAAADFPSGGAYDEGNTGGMVIDELVNEGLAEADIPQPFFWYPISFLIAIGLGFGAFGLTKSLLVQSIVSGVVMAAFCGGGVLGDGLLPWFTVVIFGIEAAMILVIQEKFAT